jgi:uncharacterized protein YjeT (DUF2065 family)
MNIPMVLAEFYGGLLIIVGLTALNKKYIKSIFAEIGSSSALLWITGLITFILGMMTLALYSAWTSDWRVTITIIGWLTLIKGIFMTLFPKASMTLYRKATSNHLVVFAGAVAVVLGVILLYVGVTG